MGERVEEGVARPAILPPLSPFPFSPGRATPFSPRSPISRPRVKTRSKTPIFGLLAKEGAVLQYKASAHVAGWPAPCKRRLNLIPANRASSVNWDHVVPGWLTPCKPWLKLNPANRASPVNSCDRPVHMPSHNLIYNYFYCK